MKKYLLQKTTFFITLGLLFSFPGCVQTAEDHLTKYTITTHQYQMVEYDLAISQTFENNENLTFKNEKVVIIFM